MDETTLVNSSPIKDSTYLKGCNETESKPDKVLSKCSASKVKKSTVDEEKSTVELRLQYNAINADTSKLLRDISSLKQALKIVQTYEEEKRTLFLIDKWRDISQKGLSYMMNSTLLKIDKVGGYSELRKKELEAEKRKLEYELENDLEAQYEDTIESEDFKMLPDDVQQDYKERFEEEKNKVEAWKEKKFEELDSKINGISNESFTMQELCKRLKVEHNLVFNDSDETNSLSNEDR